MQDSGKGLINSLRRAAPKRMLSLMALCSGKKEKRECSKVGIRQEAGGTRDGPGGGGGQAVDGRKETHEDLWEFRKQGREK